MPYLQYPELVAAPAAYDLSPSYTFVYGMISARDLAKSSLAKSRWVAR